jgi:peptide/nickel transport system substrate-binding protein
VTARRAAARATDASKWRKDTQADVATAANSPYGPGQPGYLQDNGYPTFDLAEAKKLVQQYEAETGKPFEFTFLVAEDNTNLAIGQAFTSGFQEAGMKVTLEQKPQINLLAGVAVGQYQMSQFRVFASPNPDADVHFYRSPPPGASISLNFPRYVNPEVDAAIDTAIGSTDEATRNTAYTTINKIFADQVPFLWLGQNDWMLAANTKVNGIYPAVNGSIATVGPKTWIAGLSKAR